MHVECSRQARMISTVRESAVAVAAAVGVPRRRVRKEGNKDRVESTDE